MMNIDFIRKEMTLNHPIEKVWETITEPTSVAKWFGSNACYELQEGAQGYFEWQEHCAGRYAMQIVKIQPVSCFAWRWMYEKDVPFEQSQSTLVEWTLKPTVSGKTHLLLIESGFSDEHRRKMNVQGWNQELNDLRLYLQ
ncbi:MAG: SRPBCC domain-containing protein [Aestuariibacter sp.]